MIKKCPECGVPSRISREHHWLNNGVIDVSREPDHRMLFFESENVKALFKNVEETLGIPIEHIIIEAHRRTAYDYIVTFVPNVLKKLLKVVGL